jgi:hypothetical protein
MSTRARPAKPVSRPAPRPRRLRERDAQPIPREGPAFDWRPNELVVGGPRPARKAREAGNA